MKRRQAGLIPVVFVVAAALALGCLSAWFVPLERWVPALTGLITASSLLAGAALVRMARNAPITSPSAFDEEDLDRFFDTLETLARRLFWLFVQAIVVIGMLIAAAVIASPQHPQMFSYYEQTCRLTSGALAASTFWLFCRMISMAKGDLGFVSLQRRVLENALKRDQRKEVAKIVSSSVTRVSPGRFGG